MSLLLLLVLASNRLDTQRISIMVCTVSLELADKLQIIAFSHSGRYLETELNTSL